MNRALTTLFFFAGWLVFSHGQAEAMTEFCPATIQLRAVGGVPAASPAQVYGFELDAAGPRTVMATIYFDTNQGWFTADVPSVQLREKQRTYVGDSFAYKERDWASPAMYLRFSQGVVIRRAWVHTALSQGDTFGWQNEGLAECMPPSLDRTAQVPPMSGVLPIAQAGELDSLAEAPNAQSVVVIPKASSSVETASCALPFANPSVKRQAQPEYPDSARGLPPGTIRVQVTVAIPADGGPTDFWISIPSESAALNAAALDAARNSTYNNAISYCQSVPSFFYFNVTFVPGGVP